MNVAAALSPAHAEWLRLLRDEGPQHINTGPWGRHRLCDRGTGRGLLTYREPHPLFDVITSAGCAALEAYDAALRARIGLSTEPNDA